jgi:hypothetical protein
VDVALGGGFLCLLRSVLVWENITEFEFFLRQMLTQNRHLGI